MTRFDSKISSRDQLKNDRAGNLARGPGASVMIVIGGGFPGRGGLGNKDPKDQDTSETCLGLVCC